MEEEGEGGRIWAEATAGEEGKDVDGEIEVAEGQVVVEGKEEAGGSAGFVAGVGHRKLEEKGRRWWSEDAAAAFIWASSEGLGPVIGVGLREQSGLPLT